METLFAEYAALLTHFRTAKKIHAKLMEFTNIYIVYTYSKAFRVNFIKLRVSLEL